MECQGKNNRIVTREQAETARQNIRDLTRAQATTLNSGIDPTVLVEYGKLATHHVEAGIRAFDDFRKVIIAEAKAQKHDINAISPHIESLYREACKKAGVEPDEIGITKQLKLDQLQEQRNLKAAQQKLKEGIDEAVAKGKLDDIKSKSPADWNWLQADPRRLELAYDPDTKSFKPREAQAALEAESKGIIKGPIRRAIDESGRSRGGDYIDADGRAWDVKDAREGAKKIAEIANPKPNGATEDILVDALDLTPAEVQALEVAIRAQLKPGAGQVRFVTK